MKILITTSTFPASDTDEVPAFVKEQAIALKKHDPDLEILVHAPHNHYSGTASGAARSDFYREIRFHYFWPHRLELLAGRGILPALRAHRLLYLQIPFLVVFQFLSLWRLARLEKPDLIYAHWFTPQAITADLVSKVTGIPFVFTTHASDVSILAGIPFSRSLVRQVCGRARRFTAVSDRTAEKLRSIFPAQEWYGQFAAKLAIIPMGVDVQVPSVAAEVLDRTRTKFALDDRPVLLYLGRLAEKKGVTFLLAALSLLPGELRQNLQVVIAGDGQLKRDLQSQAGSLG
ncbi:MAG: glycosyltransferase, partial [Wenzhouxiangellaceae bacterium]